MNNRCPKESFIPMPRRGPTAFLGREIVNNIVIGVPGRNTCVGSPCGLVRVTVWKTGGKADSLGIFLKSRLLQVAVLDRSRYATMTSPGLPDCTTVPSLRRKQR